MPPTKEQEALAAALRGDDNELERLVKELYRTERNNLRLGCEMVVNVCNMVQRGSNRL